MHRQKKHPTAPGNGRGFAKADIVAPERSDFSRLNIILAFGFGVAAGYSDMNRDRHYVLLKEGKTPGELLRFCQKQLEGGPMPGADPITDGPRLLKIFQAAEAEGLVSLNHVPAGRFIPERGAES
jgi:hypothetical protein